MDRLFLKIPTISTSKYTESDKESVNVDKNLNSVPHFGKEWESLAKFLRLVGHFPILIEGKTGNAVYKFSVLSVVFACTILFGLIRVLIFVREYTDSEKYYTGGVNSVKVEDLSGLELHVSGIFQVSMPILNLLELFSVIWAAPLFASFLNTWEKFNQHMCEIVSDLKPKTNEPHRQNKLLRLNKGVIFCLLLPVVFIHIISFGHRILNGSPLTTSIYSEIFFKIFMHLITAVEETKIILMFQTLSAAFRQVRKYGIEQMIKEYNENLLEKKTLSARKIRRVLNTLKIVRDQVKLVADCQSFHQLLFYMFMTVFVSLLLFMEFCLALKDKSSYYRLSSNAGLISFFFFRIFLKGYSAEQITCEEQRIVKELAEWDLTESSLEIKFEVKHLIDYLSVHQSKIRYSGLISLDRKLILSVSTQIITYLIVLMQFRL